MKKKIISIILVIATMLCMFSMISFADETRELVSAVADNDTSNLIERFSLSDVDDGRVETDKSVNYNADNYNVYGDYNTDEFSVTLSAMGQAYTRNITEETETEESMHTDVLFILDVSSSMYDNKMAGSTQNRVYGTVQALNTAINKLIEADPEVRFGIICYGTNYYSGTTRSETATTWTDSTSKTLTTSWQKVTINNKSFYAKYSGSYSNYTVYLNTTGSDTGAVKISSGIYYKINGVVVKNNGNKTISCSTGSTTKSTTINYESGIYLPIGKYTLAGSGSSSSSSGTETIAVTSSSYTSATINGVTFYYRRSRSSSSTSVYICNSSSGTGATTVSNGSTVEYNGLTITNNSTTLTITYKVEGGSSTPVTNGEWVTYTANVATSTDRISTSANIRDENGNAVAVTSRDVATNKDGTYTQAGLQAAVTMFNNVVDKENRVPATVLITDGVPTIADEDIYTVDAFPGNSSSRDEMLHSIRNIINYGYASYIGDSTKNGYPSGTPIEAGLTIKTALEVKKRIDAMYEDADALYFTIGPGVDYNFGKLFLDPSITNMETSKNDTTANSTMYGAATPKTLYEWLSNNMTDSAYNELTTLADYSIADNFTIEKYEQAMEVLVGKIVNKTIRPIAIKKSTTTITPSMGIENYVYFEDTLDNMIVTGEPCIISNEIVYQPISNTVTEDYIEYKYELNNTSVFVYENSIKWLFGSELLPLLIKGTDGYDTVTPIRCVFKVGIDVIDDVDETFYTNEDCMSTFIPNTGNPYYKDYTNTTVNKTENKTNTASYVNVVSKVDDYICSSLGNNGKIKFDVWFDNQTLVLDYGLPVEYNIKANNTITDVDYSYVETNTNGKSGSFTCDTDGNTRYELNTMKFNSTDDFDVPVHISSICGVNANLNTTERITYVPAKIMYFEDNFVSFDSNWTKVGTTLDECQASDILGDIENNDVYGKDEANDACVTYSMGSAMKTTVYNTNTVGNFPKATFTFKGTGFDIISVTDNESAVMTIKVKNKTTGKNVTSRMVDNYYGVTRDEETGEWSYVDGGITEYTSLYQIPVCRVLDLPYDEYEVTIEARYTTKFRKQDKEWDNWGTIYVDAIRIYTPAEDYDDEYYSKDNEGWAEFISVHTYLTEWCEGDESISGVMFIDGDNSTSSFEDLITAAPTHEIYLDTDQSIAFNLNGDNSKVATVQIGVKSLDGSEVYLKVVNNGEITRIRTSATTDQYYKIGTSIGNEYTLTNRGSNILSITNIKITYTENPNVALMFLAPNMNMCMAMISMPDIEEEETTKETTIDEEIITDEPTTEEEIVEETTETNETANTLNSFIKFIKAFIEFFKKLFSRQ